MNKRELVSTVASQTNFTKKEIDMILTTILETIIEAVSSGDKITLVGFGSFEARERNSREGRNPTTGEKINIPATKVPAFSVGKFFKKKLNA
jgi:DNA-binding protein HU-beta